MNESHTVVTDMLDGLTESIVLVSILAEDEPDLFSAGELDAITDLMDVLVQHSFSQMEDNNDV